VHNIAIEHKTAMRSWGAKERLPDPEEVEDLDGDGKREEAPPRHLVVRLGGQYDHGQKEQEERNDAAISNSTAQEMSAMNAYRLVTCQQLVASADNMALPVV
jgi:hypothetical protein